MDGAGSAGFQKPVDMANEELFPDLATADKIIEEKEQREKEEQDRMAKSGTARAPTGWGSRMGQPGGSAAPAERKALNLSKPVERKPLNLAAAPKKTEEAQPAVEKKEEEAKPEASEASVAETPAAAAAPAAAEKPKEKKVLKKKKKKDLSTFKVKS